MDYPWGFLEEEIAGFIIPLMVSATWPKMKIPSSQKVNTQLWKDTLEGCMNFPYSIRACVPYSANIFMGAHLFIRLKFFYTSCIFFFMRVHAGSHLNLRIFSQMLSNQVTSVGWFLFFYLTDCQKLNTNLGDYMIYRHYKTCRVAEKSYRFKISQLNCVQSE